MMLVHNGVVKITMGKHHDQFDGADGPISITLDGAWVHIMYCRHDECIHQIYPSHAVSSITVHETKEEDQLMLLKNVICGYGGVDHLREEDLFGASIPTLCPQGCSVIRDAVCEHGFHSVLVELDTKK